MPRRIRIVHWKPAEAAPLIGAVRAAGFEPEYGGDLDFPALSRAIHANLPDAVLIDLSRLPSHGREIEIWLRGIKATRNIPLLFANGEDAKRERVRKDMPDATFTTTEKLGPSLQAACLEPVRNPIVPPRMMERQRDKPTAMKLGIAPSSTVAVI
ncbi:MAG TPA: hypothetical protein VFC21_09385, partial [Bryobacteraceae bacterium]|nr:hypothetical protein [Bryobacteraceae bacterium]